MMFLGLFHFYYFEVFLFMILGAKWIGESQKAEHFEYGRAVWQHRIGCQNKVIFISFLFTYVSDPEAEVHNSNI